MGSCGWLYMSILWWQVYAFVGILNYNWIAFGHMGAVKSKITSNFALHRAFLYAP